MLPIQSVEAVNDVPRADAASRPQTLMDPWRFYVYELVDDQGRALYVGKGSGARLAAQRRNHRLQGHEVARFKREKDAYAFERARIADRAPARNKHPGGNGSTCTPRRAPRKPKWLAQIEAIGTKAYAARILLATHQAVGHSRGTRKYDADFLAAVDGLDVSALRAVAYPSNLGAI
jgi:hypothetical protein